MFTKPPYIIQAKWIEYLGINGIAIWPFIFVIDISNQRLVTHEKVHIEQQIHGWLIGFYIKYFYYLFRYGYKNNPYEVEARARQYDFEDNDERAGYK